MKKSPQIIGLKLFYYHALEEKREEVWQWLEKHQEIKIIHLIRQNLLDTYVSLQYANLTNSWIIKPKDIQEDKSQYFKNDTKSITVNPSSLEKYFEKIDFYVKKIRNMFTNRSYYMEVYYKDLDTNYYSTITNLFEFLGVKKKLNSKPILKQSSRPNQEKITNYEELAAHFRKTKWSKFFEQQDTRFMKVNNSECNICGGKEFIEGWNGRLCSGKKPKCKKCGSLERHRAIRNFFMLVKKVFPLERYSCLQISSDLSIDKSWFDNYELSVYGTNNSIDVQNIERPDSSYDLVICNHVLEHVEDDIKGLKEMIRILKPTGFLELLVPSPYYRKTTDDWGYPDSNRSGHYRAYGRDIENKFQKSILYPYLSCIVVDPVTNGKDILYIYTKSLSVLEKIDKVCSSYSYSTEIFVPNGYVDSSEKEQEHDIKYPKQVDKMVAPTNIPGWYFKTHFDFFNFMITHLPDQCTLVECGVFFGRSTIDLAKRLQLAGKKFHIFAVDSFHWHGWIKREGFSNEELRNEFDKVVSLCGKDMFKIFHHYLLENNLKNVITPVKSQILDYVKEVEDRSIDLCYIDSSHLYQDTIDEIQAWLPKIKVGGWLCGDDYDREAVKNAVIQTIPQAKAWDNGRIWYLQIQE